MLVEVELVFAELVYLGEYLRVCVGVGGEQLVEFADEHVVLLGEKADGDAFLACSARATDAMNVAVDVGGQVQIDHHLDVFDVQTPRGHVARHQDALLLPFEVFQNAFSLPLLFVPVNGLDVYPVGLQLFADVVALLFGLAEHETLILSQLETFDDGNELSLFELLVNNDEELADV